MDGNDSPNISCGDSDSNNQSMLTSSLNAQVDSYIVNDQGDSYIVNSETRSPVDSFVCDSYIVKTRDKISDCNISYSQHSGSVNFEHGRLKNGRRAAICQLDGNASIDTTTQDVTNVANLSISAVASVATSPTNIGVSNRMTASASLPVIAVINCRSLQPKQKSLVEKFQNENFSIAILCEVWEKTGKKNLYFQSKVEEMLEIDGLKYISCGSRPSGKRGGGVAILIDSKKMTIENLQIHVPNNLEVLWAMVRPKELCPGAKFKEYVVCSFYSPPSSRKNKKLLDHLISTTHALMARFPTAAFFLAGDKNDLPISSLIQGLPKFVQIVANCTHGGKIIDVLLMNCSQMYAVPQISSPLLPDNPRHAKPSDHSVPVARPLCLAAEPISNVYTEKTCRPLPDSAVREFMHWIHTESWDSVPENGSTSAQVEAYEKVVDNKVNHLFPEKSIRITKKDKEFITSELKTLDRKKKREWKNKGKSEKYIQLRNEFRQKYKKAASDFLKKCVSDLKISEPGKAAATLKRMGAQPGDCE